MFPMQGRVNHAKYFGIVLAISIGTQILAFAAGVGIGISGGSEQVAGMLGLFIGILGAFAVAVQVVKRLHDIGKSGAYYCLLMIPIYKIYLGLVLLFKKGNDDPNEYGRPLWQLSEILLYYTGN